MLPTQNSRSASTVMQICSSPQLTLMSAQPETGPPISVPRLQMAQRANTLLHPTSHAWRQLELHLPRVLFVSYSSITKWARCSPVVFISKNKELTHDFSNP